MGKVSWMTRSQTVNSTIIVGVFAFIIAIFLFTLDVGLSELVNILFNSTFDSIAFLIHKFIFSEYKFLYMKEINIIIKKHLIA